MLITRVSEDGYGEEDAMECPPHYRDECLSCRWYGVDRETGCERNEYPEPCPRYVPNVEEAEEYLPDEDTCEEVVER